MKRKQPKKKKKSKLKRFLKLGILSALGAIVGFYITLQMNKPVLELIPQKFVDCDCYLAAGWVDNQPVFKIMFRVKNIGNVVAKDIRPEWDVIEISTKKFGKWNLNPSSKFILSEKYGVYDLQPDAFYTHGVKQGINPKNYDEEQIFNEFNTGNGYAIYDVKFTYKNGLFPFIKHELAIREQFHRNRTSVFSQKYSFY